MGVKDATYRQTKALANGASSVSTDGFDLRNGVNGDFLAPCELKVSAPASGTNLGDGHTTKYKIEHDTDPAFGSVATLLPDVIIQTGAGGAGAAAATKTVRLPVDVKQYVRVTATNSNAENLSAVSMTAELLF